MTDNTHIYTNKRAGAIRAQILSRPRTMETAIHTWHATCFSLAIVQSGLVCDKSLFQSCCYSVHFNLAFVSVSVLLASLLMGHVIILQVAYIHLQRLLLQSPLLWLCTLALVSVEFFSHLFRDLEPVRTPVPLNSVVSPVHCSYFSATSVHFRSYLFTSTRICSLSFVSAQDFHTRSL